MMVTFISQCQKKALNRTRRVLDAFANRIGDNTWQTVITEDGLIAVKTLLRKTATKNTAVACHRIRSRSRSELVWIVGNRRCFNSEGIVPVNSTYKDLMKRDWESMNQNADVIAILAGIAGLFHDFGKANALFQKKLSPNYKGKRFEAYRHEWVSLRLFQAFVGNQTDLEWLKALQFIRERDEEKILVHLELINDSLNTNNNPMKALPPLAKLVAWLIVSHHRLPVYPRDFLNSPPEYKKISEWLDCFNCFWNSTNSCGEWNKGLIEDNWSFPNGTPIRSKTWQKHANELATRALDVKRLTMQDWFDQRFTAHFSRLVLMLSDHYYSSLEKPTLKWQDKSYAAYANTQTNSETKQREYKQKLDEHNIGVGQNAFVLARALPKLGSELPNLGYNKVLERGVTNNKAKADHSFLWQNDAYKLALSVQEESEIHGFFGINMASTGKGKTLANARIMYALSNIKKGCRFSVALGLRTLTKQTGDALAEKLELDKDQIAVLIGSQAFKQLYGSPAEDDQSEQQKRNSFNGSESLDALANEDFDVLYDERPYEGVLAKWLKASPKVQKMLHAPILVSTIDYLTPATEGTRGGKQIAPMLRLFTSDLVLDEPDDFGLEDLPALCRLVNWAGMLGSKVLLSTATMPPALANALFQAYQAGWKSYSEVNSEKGVTENICCAWFDEFDCKYATINEKDFPQHHHQFVEKRIANLAKDKKILRKARFLPINCADVDTVIDDLAAVINQSIHQLHYEHKQTHASGKTVSIGLVRMANINPLVAVARQLIKIPSQVDYHIHYCVYHGQYPLAARSYIEEKLDAALKRDDAVAIWNQSEIAHAINHQPEKHHVFVVLATSVAEVGRDHDYDWAIAEPSSMRSLIQLAGRIQRHRQQEPKTENFLILTKNVKALRSISPAYCKPGFEVIGKYGNNTRLLANNDLSEVLATEYLNQINAIPRIQSPKSKEPKKRDSKYLDFVEMEQRALFQRLLGIDKEEDKATYWWNNEATWCAEIQRRQPFRNSPPDVAYCLVMTEGEELYWAKKDDTKYPVCYPPAENIMPTHITEGAGNSFWIKTDTQEVYSELAEKFDLPLEHCSRRFGELRLRKNDKKTIEWYYNPYLGVFNEI